jgi:hypothetical protein
MNCTLLVIGVSLFMGCGHRAETQHKTPAEPRAIAIQTPGSSPANNTASDNPKVSTKNEVPAEFHDIDFTNLTYPISHSTANALKLRRDRVQLTDGKAEYPAQIAGGTSYDLRDVSFTDLNGDSRKEAVVRLSQVICGGSCDGGTDLFYFYTTDHGQPFVLSRLEIGSYAYDCGLKSFVLKSRDLALETYRSCKFSGSSFRPAHDDPKERGGKLMTNRYTEFTFYFNSAKFIQRTRKVRWYPDEYDYRGHQQNIEVNN